MRLRTFGLALVFASVAQAEVVRATGDVTVRWDPTGSFIIESFDGTSRIDVRTSKVAELEESPPTATELKPSRRSPDGKASATIALNTASREGVWKNGVFSVAAEKGDHGLLVTKGTESFKVASVDAIAAADVYWSPDSQYVAFVVRESTWVGMDGSASRTVYAGAAGPRAQVLGPKDVLTAASARAVKAVEAAGAFVVFTGPSKKARDTSVVYAAEGHEARARAIADALPGGATVEKLSWAAGADLVIALGASAKGGAR